MAFKQKIDELDGDCKQKERQVKEKEAIIEKIQK